MQTAKILEALYLPIYARAEKEAPEASDLMPDRFYRPKRSVAGVLRKGIQAASNMAGQFKAMFGGKS
jgi:hypothetical protein